MGTSEEFTDLLRPVKIIDNVPISHFTWDMTISPGTYTIHDASSDRAIDYGKSTRIGTWEYDGGESQQWRIKSYPGSSGYALQNVLSDKYIPTKASGPDTFGVDEGNAGIFNLEHQFRDIYLVKLVGSNVYLDHPYVELEMKYVPVSFAKKDINTIKSSFWRLERISDDIGSTLKPRPGKLLPDHSIFQSDAWDSNLNSLYTDEAHLYTNMIFNMPYTPFTRDQRIVALDWARKLGANNVPTIESLDECETAGSHNREHQRS
ncbi:hypothetical protein RSOLAG1IB_04956 [Rhizoctonia solani AG-1 IB]|uniref:Ricin B lectin domain-containing protein n=1 Tax=Thanatephorus cucumeris (strain AG1-IB / isolate 7/3/14) TaxID=1108050 RepID=A0A0B7FY24_THACB|nr:hypothetical protein RSOLAG1IB_04956 [Rhizoctonia solani AG-1 IB]